MCRLAVAFQLVVAVTAQQHIAAAFAPDRVVAGSAVQRVVAGRSVAAGEGQVVREGVVGKQCVGAEPTVDEVIAPAAQ